MNTQLNPFAVRMLFLRVGWMTRYAGIKGGDAISGGGAYVDEHGFGHEIFNFQQYQNMVFGYVQPPSRKDRWDGARIHLTRLGATTKDQFVSGVLAVWVARGFIVGWYKNATVFEKWQSPPSDSGRRYADADCGYYVSAKEKDAELLQPDERTFQIPQKGKGAFGQSNIWYADNPSIHQELRLNVLRYVESRQLPSVPQPEGSVPHQPDPLLRQRVERIAVETTATHFTNLGYSVNSVEKDNLGWDLNAVLGKRALKLEVKGLSGLQIVAELTPNEFAVMQKFRESYRVCVVTNTLIDPRLEVFAFSQESGHWESQKRRVLNIQEIIAARCSVITQTQLAIGRTG